MRARDSILLLAAGAAVTACSLSSAPSGVADEATGSGAATDPTVGAGLLTRVHAHNDYEHERPLLDALAVGCMSVEADIHLVDGELLVAHARDECRAGRTLQRLYLEPLAARVAANGGRVYRDGPAEFQLLVDFKSAGADAERAYELLAAELGDLSSIVSTFVPHEPRRAGAVLVVLSGNAPRERVLGDAPRFCALDGWFDDVAAGRSSDEVPLLSASWREEFTWDGTGPLPDADRVKLAETVVRARGSGRMLRFWAAPDVPTAWRVLHEAGVDWLNVDDLVGVRRFFDRRTEARN